MLPLVTRQPHKDGTVTMNPSTLPYHTRVQLAVPRKVFPECLARLRKSQRFQPIGEGVFSGIGLLEAVEDSRPDILLLDLTLPELDSKKALSALADRSYPPYVVATAPRWEPLLVKARLQRVVRGILPHPLALSPVLPHILAGIAEGCEYVVPRIPADHRLFGLTGDELVLLGLMAAGLEASEIMQELDCTINVVYTNQSQLRKKLGVQTNEQALLAGIGSGLVGILSESDCHAAAGGSR
jgi:DNA-binding NarL/FixJ family response regulator